MAGFIVKLDRGKCIGAAACTIANPKLWKLGGDGKVDIIGGKKNEDNSVQTHEIGGEELNENLDAAQSCPVHAISIIKKKSGEKLI